MSPPIPATAEVASKEDLLFLERISPVINGKKYPLLPPKLPPSERQRRRLVWRNDRKLYKRKCSLTGEEILSCFHPTNPHTVYSRPAWWGDRWNALSYGREFDFNSPFFPQFKELLETVPLPTTEGLQNENCDYGNVVYYSKDSYMCFGAQKMRDCFYMGYSTATTDCADCLILFEGELCHECVDCTGSYNLRFSRNCQNCSDSSFLMDCLGCKHCFCCVNLKNSEYRFMNEQLSKEEFERRMAAIDLSTWSTCEEWRRRFAEFSLKSPKKACRNVHCENATGDNLVDCKNVSQCFDLYNAQDCRYVHFGVGDEGPVLNCGDSFGITGELDYEVSNVAYVKGSVCSVACERGSNIYCSAFCYYCNHIFGCVGLRNAEYCVFNKQYSRQEYFPLVDKLIGHMQKTTEWGEFFPIALSPFAYNESLAQEYFPLSRDEVAARGWRWREQEDTIPHVTKTIPAERLPDSIDAVPNDVLNWALICPVTKRPFRLVRQELALYRKLRTPIPHLHPEERHMRRFHMRNPHTLWTSACAKCGKAIQTTYSPDRPETVYCEQCYLETVY